MQTRLYSRSLKAGLFFAVLLCAAACLVTARAWSLGTVHGHARFEKVKGNLALGYKELYEYKAFLSPNGNGTGYSYHCGDPGTAWHPGTGCFVFPNVPGGTYSLLTTFAEFFPRGKVTSGLVVANSGTTEQNSEEPIDYSGYYSVTEWDPSGYRTIYQTFVATGTSISRASFAKADNQTGGQIEFSIHRDNGGNVETWPQIGPTRSVNRGGYGGDHWVGWQAGEVPTTPGETYAVRLNATSLVNIQPYWCNDVLYPLGTGYRGRQSDPAGHDYYIVVFADNDDTIATLMVRSHGYGNLADDTSHPRWAQSYTARGSSLAAAALLATTGGSGGWNFPVRVTVHSQTPNGPVVGPTKVMPCAYAPFFGVAGVSYSRGEVPTSIGQTYWIVYEKADGGDFNASRQNEWNVYDGGTSSYYDGSTWHDQTFDLFMNIYEYASGEATPTPGPTFTPSPTPVAGANLLENWSFEQSSGSTHPGWTNNTSVSTNGLFPNPGEAVDGLNWASYSYGGGGTARHELYQVVTVIPGHDYYLEAWANLGGTDGVATAQLMWNDGGYPGGFASLPLDDLTWASGNDIIDWTRLSGLVTATKTQLTFTLRIDVNGWGGGVNLDACQLVDQSGPQPTDTPTSTSTNTPTHTPTATGIPEPDTDGDGIPDSLEGEAFPAEGQTNMYLPDSDGDGLADGTEDANRNGIHEPGTETNGRDMDTDGDTFWDGIEALIMGTNPLNASDPSSPPADGDGDGLPAPDDPNDSSADTDGDRFSDGYEAAVVGLPAVSDGGVKPDLGDVNGDGIWDNADAQLILNFFARKPAPSCDPAHSDLDRNGVIDNADAQNSLTFFARILSTLPKD